MSWQSGQVRPSSGHRYQPQAQPGHGNQFANIQGQGHIQSHGASSIGMPLVTSNSQFPGQDMAMQSQAMNGPMNMVNSQYGQPIGKVQSNTVHNFNQNNVNQGLTSQSSANYYYSGNISGPPSLNNQQNLISPQVNGSVPRESPTAGVGKNAMPIGQSMSQSSFPVSRSSSNPTSMMNSQTGLMNSQTSLTNSQTGLMNSQTGLVNSQTGLTNSQTGSQVAGNQPPQTDGHRVSPAKRRVYPKQASAKAPTMPNAPPPPLGGDSMSNSMSSNMPPSTSTYDNRLMRNNIQPNTQATSMTQPPNIYQNQGQPGCSRLNAPPNTQQTKPATGMQQMQGSFGRLTVEQSNTYPVNLMEQRAIITPSPIEPLPPPFEQEMKKKSVLPSVFRCTLNSLPQSSSLLSKSRLPFGIYIHPFRDIPSMPTLQTNVITRCKACRTYINPFVLSFNSRRWQCNMCFRLNDVPEELNYDHLTRSYIDPKRRPELNSSSIEFIAPSEYMLRPPQPAVFLFVLDVSFNAVGTGYLSQVCQEIKQNIDRIPGDSRTTIGFMTFNSSIHFYDLRAGQTQPQMFIVSDLEEVFIPTPEGLMVNLRENKEMIIQLLDNLPDTFANVTDVHTATGTVMDAAHKLISSTGGRVTVFQTCLPSIGPGKLGRRELGNMQGNSKDVQNLNPASDYYKKLALDCAGDQVAVDLFVLSGQYIDLASLSCVSKYSSGCVYYFQDYHATKNPAMAEKLEHDFRHYLTRNVGFEAVMRVRCTKGLSIHTFHGNFFVRSTDLLSLPNVNPDHSFSMQIAIDENLVDSSTACFQAALLYTTARGERRIRVHTLALPVTNKLSDVCAYADQQAVTSLLSKMAVDRTLMSSLGDAREALMNSCIDCLSVYRSDLSGQKTSGNVLAPTSLRLLPLYVLALFKHEAFRLGSGVSLDARTNALLQFKTLPLADAMTFIYPRMYSLLDLLDENAMKTTSTKYPPLLQCSAERLNRQCVFLMDSGKALFIFVGKNVTEDVLRDLFNVDNFQSIPDNMIKLPELDNYLSNETRDLIDRIRDNRCYYPVLHILREDSRNRMLFINSLIDDRSESVMSYSEFLMHLQKQMNK